MSEQSRIIKKYPNRRLYDTATSSYITLQDVKKLVTEQVEFRVEDAKTHEDLTHNILLQIILDEESGNPIFSSDALSQIIRSYGQAMQGLMGDYIEKNIQAFIEIQKKMQTPPQATPNERPPLGSDTMSEFLRMQAPAMQGLMSNYLEQSATAFIEMQKQTRNILNAFPGGFPFPNFFAPPYTPPKPQDTTTDNDSDNESQDDQSGSRKKTA